MKLVITGILIFLSHNSFAKEITWQEEQPIWEQKAQQMSTPLLVLEWTQQVTSAVVICGASEATVVAAFAADTIPGVNSVSEMVANIVDDKYNSYNSGHALSDTAHGVFAGAGAIVQDSVEFVFLFLSGETDQAWYNIKNSYASSQAIEAKMNQDSAMCPRTSHIELILRKELFGRYWGTEAATSQKEIQLQN